MVTNFFYTKQKKLWCQLISSNPKARPMFFPSWQQKSPDARDVSNPRHSWPAACAATFVPAHAAQPNEAKRHLVFHDRRK
jgi:hypothetical protein